MVSSSTLRWLGSATLAGFLLASTAPLLASPQIKTTDIKPSKPLLVASAVFNSVPSGTYTQAVRKQMQWRPIKDVSEGVVTAVPAPSVSVTVAQKSTQPETAVQAPKTSNENSKPVKVAATPKQQVSRSASSSLVDNALSLQGVPYVFGGSSTNGFDCSGYTQYVFNGSGSSLPRSSYDQFKSGSTVTRENLQPGDLVFFTTYAKGPSHVGIYIGGGSFIHASNSGVRTTSLSDSYYDGRYVGARRVE